MYSTEMYILVHLVHQTSSVMLIAGIFLSVPTEHCGEAHEKGDSTVYVHNEILFGKENKPIATCRITSESSTHNLQQAILDNTHFSVGMLYLKI